MWHGRRMKSYNKNEIYGIWKNQLALEFKPERPDVLAVIALASGFEPAWVECETREIEDVKHAK